MSGRAGSDLVWSKTLFGNRHMLRVAQEIAQRADRFTVQDLARATTVPYSSTHRVVTQLATAGLVHPTPGDPDPSHRWYTRAAHRFWDAAQELCVTDKPQSKRPKKARKESDGA